MAAKFFSFAILSLGLIASCSQVAPQPTRPAIERSPQKFIGVLEHRGKFYRIEDLMDPSYRAESDDPFVKGFMADSHLATPWAGRQPDTFSRLRRASGRIPWAGDGPEEP